MKLITTQQSVTVAGGLTNQQAYEGQKSLSGLCGIAASVMGAVYFAGLNSSIIGNPYARAGAVIAAIAVYPVAAAVGGVVGGLAYNVGTQIERTADYMMKPAV